MSNDVELSRIVEELVEIRRLLMLQLQEAHGWSQRELATKLGINQSTISRTLGARFTTRGAGKQSRKGGRGNGSKR